MSRRLCYFCLCVYCENLYLEQQNLTKRNDIEDYCNEFSVVTFTWNVCFNIVSNSTSWGSDLQGVYRVQCI